MDVQKTDADRSVPTETISIEPYAGEPVSKHPDSEYEYANAIGSALPRRHRGRRSVGTYWVLRDMGTEYGGSNHSGAKLCQNTALECNFLGVQSMRVA